MILFHHIFTISFTIFHLLLIPSTILFYPYFHHPLHCTKVIHGIGDTVIAHLQDMKSIIGNLD